MRSLSLALLLLVPTLALAQDPIIVDDGSPERGAGDGERMVVEVGAPAANSQEHAFVEHVAHALDATETWTGEYDLDKLIADIADPARREGTRKKIATLIFAGHMLYVAPHGDDIVKDQNGVPYGYLVAGAATYDADLHAHLVAKLEAALRAKGLAFSDVFAPGAVIEFKVCNGAIHATDLMEKLARDLPSGMKVKAYDQGYVWQRGAYDLLWEHDLEYQWGLLSIWFHQRPKVKFELGDQSDSLVVFPGINDGLDSMPPSSQPKKTTAPASPSSSAPASPPSQTPGITGRLLRAF